MFRLPYLVLGLVILVATAPAVETPPKSRPELNAFLNRPAKSVAQLLEQVRKDNEVADRYMRHFGMTRVEVLDYFKDLRWERLRVDMEVEQFSVPQGGMLKMRRSHLKKGEPVFADASGTPILRVKCGNPLTPGPRQDTEVSYISDMTPPVPMKGETFTVESTNSEELVALEPPVPILEEPIANPPAFHNDDPIVTTDQSQAVDRFVPPAAPLWPAVGTGLLNLAVLFDREPDNITPVPEPASVAVLAIGALALMRRRRR